MTSITKGRKYHSLFIYEMPYRHYCDSISSNDYEALRSLGTTDKLSVAAIGLTSLLASALLFMSIESKNATLASLIEITYPVFVALFSFILFKHTHINPSVMLGGILVITGAGIIMYN